MRRWTVMSGLVVIMAVFVCAAACKSSGYSPITVPAGSPLVTVDVPPAMHGIVPATWTASWVGGSGPYTIEWNFGGGAQDQEPEAATSPATVIVEMINWSRTSSVEYTYTVTVKDVLGRSGTATGRYSIGAALLPNVSIDAVDYRDNVLTVTLSHPGEWDATVTLSQVAGLSFEPESVVVPEGNGDAVFHCTADDVFSGGSGTVTISASDEHGGFDAADQAISVPGLDLVFDTLYALPMVHTAAVGEPVTIVVATSSTAHLFQFLNGVAIIVEEDAEPVSHSLNYGAIGGAWDDIDGIWERVGVTSFLTGIPEAGMIFTMPASAANEIPAGRERYDISVPSFGGSDLSFTSGLLFNFQLTFSEPGLKHIGLQQFDGVKRTYYSDGASNEYYWGTLMADEYGNLNVPGVDNTILVE